MKDKYGVKRLKDVFNIKRKKDVLIHMYKIATNTNIDGSSLEEYEMSNNKLIRHYYENNAKFPFGLFLMH